MFGNSSQGANAYAKVGIETGVISASPHKLIVMLYDGAIVAIHTALGCMKANDLANKGKAISKAIAIIDNGLRASLDKKAGGDIAKSLDALYEYMIGRLLLANLENKADYLHEVDKLLRELKSAWEIIEPKAQEVVSTTVAAHDPLAPKRTHIYEA